MGIAIERAFENVQGDASLPRRAAPNDEVRCGIHGAPYLADHGFDDVAVVPGAYYIHHVLLRERSANRISCVMRNLAFDTPIVLSSQDVVIGIHAAGGEGTSYAFYECGNASSARAYAARIEVDPSFSGSTVPRIDPSIIEALQARTPKGMNSQAFYQRLRENGNQYGTTFQKLKQIWQVGDHALSRIETAAGEDVPGALTIAIDCMVQSLAPFVLDARKPFALRAIERLDVWDSRFPGKLWARATRTRADASRVVGDVCVFDSSGQIYVQLTGVVLALLAPAADATESARKIAIAANFTAEGLDDSLKFWIRHFDAPLTTQYAPYNQVFQQLLDPQSALSRNREGFNVILLALEEWATTRPVGLLVRDPERISRHLGNREQHILPNGLAIAHLNRYETEYLYQEIFTDRCYLKHGIRLKDGATVVDIGANIGLFSLSVLSECRDPRIYAIEPAPVLHDILSANCNAYGEDNVVTLNIGISDHAGAEAFTFYEKSSVFSGFHSDERADRQAIEDVVRSMLRRQAIAPEALDESVRDLTVDRLANRTVECPLASLSQVMREHDIAHIDLLKIDAEKSEWRIIQGIEPEDWPKIDQIVVEIHDRTRDTVTRIERFLREKGFHCVVAAEDLLESAGLFNLYASRPTSAPDETCADRSTRSCLARTVEEFGAALRSFVRRTSTPLVLSFTPKSPAAQLDSTLAAALDDAEAALANVAMKTGNVTVVRSTEPLTSDPALDYYDRHGYELGHMPYTREGYAAIATALVRKLFNIHGNPYKVIVLDCDNTLWRGVCGEEGWFGVEMTAPYRALQEFMVEQMKAGMLLCLCSRNNESDVLEVFDRRSDMPLKREHLAAWRINWSAKSANIRSLASELNLGLDSFIFVDDNPLDCADVKAHCPDVLALQLPTDPERIPRFLAHVWAFDHAASTGEDLERTRMYRESARREQYREQAFSLKEFIAGLELKLTLSEAKSAQFARLAQLTLRTNQFNFTGVRRTEAEIRHFVERENARCLAAQVTDRFGDYGLVAVLMYEIGEDRYTVDTFLASCRVLNRGIEHEVLARLGQRALADGKTWVEVPYIPTGKNAPAKAFIDSIGSGYGNGSGERWVFPASYLATLRYDPAAAGALSPPSEESSAWAATARGSPRLFGSSNVGRALQAIGERWHDVDSIMSALDIGRSDEGAAEPNAAAGSEAGLEAQLARIWRTVLGKSHIGVHENFFEVGGTSLRAVQVVALIKKELGRSLSVLSLFESPTIALLSARLDSPPVSTDTPAGFAGAALRGQQRRNRALSPRHS